ncbi:hypothetical protein FXE72_05265, partial [Vibrio cholerae]
MTRFDRFHRLMVLFTTLSKVFRLFICHKKRRLKGRRWPVSYTQIPKPLLGDFFELILCFM